MIEILYSYVDPLLDKFTCFVENQLMQAQKLALSQEVTYKMREDYVDCSCAGVRSICLKLRFQIRYRNKEIIFESQTESLRIDEINYISFWQGTESLFTSVQYCDIDYEEN